jgi:hypothetical protein
MDDQEILSSLRRQLAFSDSPEFAAFKERELDARARRHLAAAVVAALDYGREGEQKAAGHLRQYHALIEMGAWADGLQALVRQYEESLKSPKA